MSEVDLRQRRRSDYFYFLSYRTRWSDNDQYSHVNNSIYYHLFDSIVNAYLIAKCGMKPQESAKIGLVVSSFCQVLDLGLRVNKLGRSSVAYEVGVFLEGREQPAAVGGYTHVFVDNKTRRSEAIDEATRAGLERARL